MRALSLRSAEAAKGIKDLIATSAEEQGIALQQVNTAITYMDQVTQLDAAMVGDGKEACSSLNAEAAHLLELVDQFHLRPESANDGASPPPQRGRLKKPRPAGERGAVSVLRRKASTGPGVRSGVTRQKARRVHGGIFLRGRQRGVAQKLLNGPQVRAGAQEVGGERMSKGVG